jgi:predicted outer membrane protein
MKRAFLTHVALAVTVGGATLGLVGCGRDDRVPRTSTHADDRVPVATDSAGGAVDSAKSGALTGVAALLSDANVFALLDTAYAALIQADTLAQQKASNPHVRQFATHALSANALTRRSVVATADRLRIAPVLPDRKVLKEHQQAMNELRTKTGKEFDKAFLDHAIEMRMELIAQVDDALSGKGVQQEEVRKFLRQLRSDLDAERKTLEDLRSKSG